MKFDELQGKKILIVGMGVEGHATRAVLLKRFPGIHIETTDLKDGPEYLKKQDGFDLAIKTPGIPKESMTIPYTTATNLFFANTRGMVIGVTGTKGKSTTASLLYAMLREAGLPAALVGNIGKPALEAMEQHDGEKTVYVFELSSYQLDDIRYSPHISVFINFFPEHMNYHGGIEQYWQAKSNIVKFQKPDDFFVYNPAYDRLSVLAKGAAKPIPMVTSLPFPQEDIPLLGRHNYDNVRAAVTAAGLLGVSTDAMQKAVQTFHGLPHRLEPVGTYREITFYDDAISTTPESTICAIEAIPHVSTILLGGQDRGYDFRQLAYAVIKHRIGNIVLFPDSGARIERALADAGAAEITFARTSNMREAVLFAYEKTPPGGVCLLSTASPSYSVWKNYIEKGNQFRQFVIDLGSVSV